MKRFKRLRRRPAQPPSGRKPVRNKAERKVRSALESCHRHTGSGGHLTGRQLGCQIWGSCFISAPQICDLGGGVKNKKEEAQIWGMDPKSPRWVVEKIQGKPLCRLFLEWNSSTNSKRKYISKKKLAKCYYDFTEFEDNEVSPKKIVSSDVESDDDDLSFAVIPEPDYEHSSPVDVSEEHVDTKLIIEMIKEERASRLEKGNLIVALLCKDGLVFAVDHSVAGADGIPASRWAFKNVLELRPGMIVCITGEISACERFKELLPPEGKWECDSVEETAALLSKFLSSSPGREGVSGILLGGWDVTGRASLYCLRNKQTVWRGDSFALGYCALLYARFGSKNVGAMAFEEAAKFARLVIRTTIAYYKRVERIYDDDEKGYSGGPVSVYCVGSDGELVDKGEEPMPNIDLSLEPEPWFRMKYTPSPPWSS